jgi:hypothetical protein
MAAWDERLALPEMLRGRVHVGLCPGIQAAAVFFPQPGQFVKLTEESGPKFHADW